MSNLINVILPVVTTEMERMEGEAAFIHDSVIQTISNYNAQLTPSSSIATCTVDTATPHNLNLGDIILISGCRLPAGTNGFGRINGVFKVTAVNSTTEIVFNISTNLSRHLSSISFTVTPGTLQSFNAPVDTTFAGPYIFDPVTGVPISNVISTTTSTINQNTSTKYLSIASTTGWNATGGYLVIGFGSSLYDKPIKYSGILNNTTLIIDPSYVFPQTIPSNTTVTMLFQKGPWVPNNITTVGAFWLADDSSGVIGCIDAINQSVASGVDVNYLIKYPSDIGLGAAGFPTNGSGKNSSIVDVYDLEGIVD